MVIINVQLSFTPAAFEFIYAQSPYNMKGLLVGLFFCRLGIWVAVAGVIFLGAPDSQYLCSMSGSASSGYRVTNNCVFWYYILFIGVGIIAFIIYTVTAVLYKNRRRDNVVNENARLSEYFTISSPDSRSISVL